MKNKELKLNVTTNEGIVERISWQASDFENNKEIETKAFMLSVWDEDKKGTLKVDLWTKDMRIDEMKIFFYEALMSMSDTFLKATGEQNIVEDLRDYCAHFAEKMKIKDSNCR